MKLLAALAIFIAIRGLWWHETQRRAARSVSRDTAVAPRKATTCPSCKRDSHGRI